MQRDPAERRRIVRNILLAVLTVILAAAVLYVGGAAVCHPAPQLPHRDRHPGNHGRQRYAERCGGV